MSLPGSKQLLTPEQFESVMRCYMQGLLTRGEARVLLGLPRDLPVEDLPLPGQVPLKRAAGIR
jgi:hypothetical protein